MEKGGKSSCKFVVIDEGPLHRIRAIRKYSESDSLRVRRILLNRRSVISDIVIYLDADPERIYQRRHSRGTRAMETSIKDIINEIDYGEIEKVVIRRGLPVFVQVAKQNIKLD